MAQPGSRPDPRADEDLPEPPQVRRLRRLVSLLVIVLIGGMVVVVVAMVLQLGTLQGARPQDPSRSALAPVSAESFPLPASAEVVAVGRAPGEVLMVTRDAGGTETLRVFDARTGAETSATPIRRE